MSLPVSVICEPPVECCPVPAPPFYTQGLTFLSAQTGFILNCPQGFSCSPGAYPHPIIIPDGAIPYTPPTGGNPLRFTCCDGVILTRYLPANFTQAQFNTAAQEIADAAAEHLALCEAQAYNAQNARQNQNCTISTPGTLPEAFSGTDYLAMLEQSGALAPVVWTLVGGALPGGLSLSADGVISGIPMVSGLFTFVAQATGAINPATRTRLICKRVFRLTVSSDVPCDLGVTDSTVISPDVAINTMEVTDTGQWASVPLGEYKIGYVGGSVQTSTGLPPNWFVNPPTTVGPVAGEAQYVYNSFGTPFRNKLPYSFCAESNAADAEANFDTTTLVCCPDAALFAGPQGRETLHFQHALGNIDVDVHDSGWTLNAVGSSLPTFRLTRVKKPAINYQTLQLRIVNLASLLPSLTPFNACTAGGGAPVWNGTFTVFDPQPNFVNYAYLIDISGGVPQLNSTLMDAPAATKIYHDTAGQDTPTGCAWILAFTYQHPIQGNVVSWVGLGGAGYAPQGTFVFSSDVVGWTMFGKKTAWRVATTAALPANTRVLNVLTANVNGALPAIDGIAISVADRVLVKNEALGQNNGSYCLDGNTEILTYEGWKHRRDLATGELVLTYNQAKGVTEWQPVQSIHEFNVVNEPVLVMRNKGHFSISSLNHRWPTENINSGKQRITLSSQLTKNTALLKAAPCGELPFKAKYTDDLVELVAWFFTEGHVRKNNSGTHSNCVRISQSSRVNPDLVGRIRSCLRGLFGDASPPRAKGGWKTDVPKWRETSTRKGLIEFDLNAAAGSRLTFLAPNRIVRIDFLRALTKAQLHLFIDTALSADGHISKSGQRSLGQKDIARLHPIQFACVLAGIPSTLGGTVAGQHTLYLNKVSRTVPSKHRDLYTGVLWCPKTENSTWVARKDGRVFITGNTVTSLGSGGTPWVLTRSTDLDTSAEMLRGIFAIVTDGNTNAGLHFRLVTNGVITLNVTPLSFTAIATTIDVELF